MKVIDSNQYVIDASVILAQLLPDEKTPGHIEAILEKFSAGNIQLITPHILKYEIANTLKTSVVRKRITPTIAVKLLKEFLLFPIEYHNINFFDVLQLAISKNLSVYDAAYLELAQSHHLPILSLDKNLSSLAI